MKLIKCLIYLAFAFFALESCTPKVQEPLAKTPEETIVEVEKIPANPCALLSDLSAVVKDETENAYVLYKDQIKQENYDKAFPLWEKAYYNAPAANGSIKYQFEDGIKIYKHFYENSDDPLKKSAYVDSIMSIYDKRIECFGEADYVAGRKAFDYYYYFNTETDLDTIYGLFKEAIDGKGKQVDYFVINPFTKILSDKIVNNEIDYEEGRKYAVLILDAINFGNNSGKNIETWGIINDYAPARLENLEGLEGFYDCQYYIKKYRKLFYENPEDCEVINTAYSRLLWGGCDKSDENVMVLKEAKEENCYTPPPPPGPLQMAYDAYTEGHYTEAIRLFENFVNQTEDVEKKFKYSLLIAKIYYGDIKNFVKSRQYAMKASDFKPSSGEPYLLIGKLYASSGPLCGPGRGWDSQIVTWPAIDMFEKAKSDPLVAEEANKFIRTYSQYMPKREDVFQRTLKVGDSIKIECWINRTTTIRTAD